ncbi:FAD-binding oxidoreductase [Persicimonas caeni]|nr:FAD-binding oxidoreductase [Persicimonas caeni]
MSTQQRQPMEGEFTPRADALRHKFRGEVLEPGDPVFEQMRRVYNANIDRHPALIARCRDVADVIAAVDFARETGRAAAIRGGGHNVGGLGTVDDEVLIDLSNLRGIRVEPKKRRVRVEGGCTIGELDHATCAFGLAVPAGIISTTGVGGLTLGGGFGHLSRQYGLTCDSLCSADIVTADGKLRYVDKDHHPDLLWAIKGGGGNYGVVTSFEFAAHPAKSIIGGPMFWSLDHTEELFAAYDQFIRRAPTQVSAFISFHIVPPMPPFPKDHHLETMCAIVWCYNGSEAEAKEVMEPLTSRIPPTFSMVGPIAYTELQSMFDGLMPHGLHHYWKSVFLRDLPAEAIEVHKEFGPRVANIHTTMHMYPLNGAVHRVGPKETAFNYRDVQYAANIVGIAETAEGLEPIKQWVREYFEALEPYSVGTGYTNFLFGDEDDKMIRAAFGDNYDRLVAIKTEYDPDNLFRINHNIRPAKARA